MSLGHGFLRRGPSARGRSGHILSPWNAWVERCGSSRPRSATWAICRPAPARCSGQVDLVACEDTRRTGRLLAGIKIKVPLVSYFEGNERERVDELLVRLGNGDDVALVTDGGTPAISDPGYRLVRACIDAGVEVQVVPGPSAAIAALVVSGLPTDRFVFEGFLPKKPGRARAPARGAAARATHDRRVRVAAARADVAARRARGDRRPRGRGGAGADEAARGGPTRSREPGAVARRRSRAQGRGRRGDRRGAGAARRPTCPPVPTRPGSWWRAACASATRRTPSPSGTV